MISSRPYINHSIQSIKPGSKSVSLHFSSKIYMPCRSQVPECPSARLEMSDLRVGVPEGPSARPLFFFLEGMEMVGLRGGVPEGPSALPFFSGRKIGSVPKYPSARPFPSPEERYKITAHIRKIYQQKNQVPKCPGRPSARSLHPIPIISHI